MSTKKLNISQAEIDEDVWDAYKTRARQDFKRSAKQQLCIDITDIIAKWKKDYSKKAIARMKKINNEQVAQNKEEVTDEKK